METEKVTFEKLKDGTQVITVQGKNMHGNSYHRQEIIKNTAVFDVIEKQFKTPNDRAAIIEDVRQYLDRYLRDRGAMTKEVDDAFAACQEDMSSRADL